MLHVTSKCIVSHNIVHPTGTKMLIFWIIQKLKKQSFVPDGCN